MDSYKKAIDNFNHQIPKLRIVGEGEMRPFIEDFIRKNKLENNISLEGAIFDENVLAEQFKKAITVFLLCKLDYRCLRVWDMGFLLLLKKTL